MGLRTRLTFNPVTTTVLNPDFLPGMLPGQRMPLDFRFGGPGSAGFTVSRRAGRTGYRLRVAAPHLDRRLVLACVLRLDRIHAPSLLQQVGDVTSRLIGR